STTSSRLCGCSSTARMPSPDGPEGLRSNGHSATQRRGGVMATKSEFTEQEWESLQKGVLGAGLLVSLSDRSFFDTFKEAGALGKHVAKEKQTGSSELVRELADGH